MSVFLASLRRRLSSLHGVMNLCGSVLLAYALANPNAVGELVEVLPKSLQWLSPVAALAWFAIVQLAKTREIRKSIAAEQEPKP